jgi:hypothetical protein
VTGAQVKRGESAGDAATCDQGEEQQRHADDRGLSGMPWAPAPHPEAHEEGDRDGAGDRKQTPWAVPERIHDDQRKDGEEDDHDGEDRHHRGETGEGTDFFLGHLAQRLAIPAHRADQDDEVLDRPGEHHAEDDPNRAR